MKKLLKSMPKLPVVSGKQVMKALAKVGYDLDHQTGVTLFFVTKNHPTGD